MSNTYEHPFSWAAILRIITALIAVFLVWKSLNILLAILVALMLATALYPVVKLLDKRLPMVLSAVIVVVLLLVPFIILGATVIPSFVKEFPGLLETVDTLINKSPIVPEQIKNIDYSQYAQSGLRYLLQSTGFVTNALTSTLTVLFLTFYFIFDANKLMRLFLSLFPKEKRPKVAALLSELAKVNGQYIRGNLLISVICGMTIFIGLYLLKVPYAAPLAIFAGVMDLLPLVGSTIAMIPAVIIGFAISPLIGIVVLALFLIYQQAENSIIAPAVYRKTLDLSAALSFLAVIIGSTLFGIIGAFLALPIAASLPAVIKYIREDNDDDIVQNRPVKSTKKKRKKS